MFAGLKWSRFAFGVLLSYCKPWKGTRQICFSTVYQKHFRRNIRASVSTARCPAG